jgi:hypothetical protein
MRIGLNIWSAISLTVCKTGALEVDLSETGWWVDRTSGVVTLGSCHTSVSFTTAGIFWV